MGQMSKRKIERKQRKWSEELAALSELKALLSV